MGDLTNKSFKAFDKDKNGVLSDEEWMEYLRGPGGFDGSETPEQIASAMAQNPTAGQIASNYGASATYDALNDVDPLSPLFDPGARDRALADAQQQAAIADWETLGTAMPTGDELYLDPDTLLPYGGPGLDLGDAESALWDPNTSGIGYVAPEFDTTGKDATTGSLDYFQDLISNGGHDAVADAAYEKRVADAAQTARGQREAAIMDAREQGTYDGGAGLMAELMAASDLSRDAHSAGMEAEAIAQARRDNAATSAGTLGSTLYSTDSHNALESAGMENDFNRVLGDWNAELGRDRANLRGQEATSTWNRNNTARDANTAQINDAKIRNAGIPQQQFENSRSIVAGKTGQLNNASQLHMDASASTPSTLLGGLQLAGNAAGAAGNAYQMLQNDEDDDEPNKRSNY